MLQGIPVDDLLFTKETEDNLKDLAGNAMSTTVVGACLLSALLVGYEALPSRAIPSTSNSPSLVPRPMTVPSNIVLSHDFGQYERTAAKLSPSLFTLNTWKSFLDSAYKSRRLCISEGPDESIPLDSILQCRECGHTSCTANAMPPRKFEKHDFDAVQGLDCRVEPATFRRELLSLLPMRIVICGLDIDVAQLTKPESVETSVWTSWLDSTASAMGSSNEYRFIHVVRSHIWTAVYRNRSMARLEARVSKLGVTWYLFSPNPPKIGAQSVELPMARLVVKPDTKNFTVTDGVWEVCLPVTTEIPITITNTGVSVPSWRKRLGLKGRFEDEMESEKLRITIDSDSEETSDLKANVDGCYRLLPDCGGACGSLRKKEDCSGKDMFFFLSAGRASLAKDNCYVLSPTCHRTSYGEFRSISLHIESDFSPISPYGSVARSSKTVNAFVHGKWVPLENATTKTSVNDRMELLVPKSKLNVPFSQSGYKVCPVLVESKVTVGIGDDLLAGCSNVGGLAELNLQKSKKLLADVAFATSRLRLPSSMENGEWLGLKLCGQMREEEWICRKCAPIKPSLRWTTATKSNRTVFVPIEDGKEAAVYERALKARPHPWLFRIGASSATELSLTIGCNPCSLAQRAFGLFSSSTLARNTWLTSASTSSNDSVFDWRVVLHSEATFTGFPALRLTSNKHNDEAGQPPNFKAHPLRKEQLRSLTWMLDQEATNDPFVEEEVTEAVLPSLNWRAEGRARRPVLVRGGIIADAVRFPWSRTYISYMLNVAELTLMFFSAILLSVLQVGYGKTAITLGLIDSTATKLRAAPEVPNSYRQGFVSTKATLVVVPKHLMGQWPDEVKKFLGSSKKVVIVKDLSTWERLKICEVVDADIVLVSFEVLMHEKYLTNLVFMCGLDLASLPRGTGGGRHYTFVYNSCLEVLPERVEMIRKDRTSAIKDIQDACKRNASAENAQKIQLDGKKAAYNNGKAATKSKVSKPAIANRDPWGLSKRETKDDFAQMTCPPLEMFFWNRLVVDE